MNKAKILIAALLAAALVPLAGCGSIAPKEKTLILSETTSAPTESNTAQSSLGFEVRKITKLPMDKIDPNGIHPDVGRAVVGWMDEDNLAAMSVQLSALVGAADPTPGAEAPRERVLTQFARINYQYGFYDPVLTLTDVEAECFDVSADGTLVAFVAGDTLDVYSLESGGLVQSCTRDVLASRAVFAQEGHDLYFTAAGDARGMECINTDTGALRAVHAGKAYRALAAGDKGLLFSVLTKGLDEVGHLEGHSFSEGLLTGGRAGSACILKGGEGLISYDGDLYLLSDGAATLVRRNVTAFDIASDGMHIAFSVVNEDGSTDIRIGYWGGSKIINDRLTYKDIDIAVDAMYFSPDVRKLYLQGMSEFNVLTAYTFEFQ